MTAIRANATPATRYTVRQPAAWATDTRERTRQHESHQEPGHQSSDDASALPRFGHVSAEREDDLSSARGQSNEKRDCGEQNEGVRGGAGEHRDAGDGEYQNREATTRDEVTERHHERETAASRPGSAPAATSPSTR